jgi:type IV secretion system protein TrbI
MAPAPLPPLITRPPTQPRQNKQVLLVVGGVVAVLLAGVIVWRMSGPRPVISREPRERLPTEQTIVGAPAPPSEDLRLPTSYARVPVAPPPPPATTVRQSTQTQIPVAPTSSTPPSSGPLPGVPIPPPPPGPPPNLPPPGVMGGPAGPIPGVAPGMPLPAGQRPKEPPERWFSAVVAPSGDVLQPPLPEDPREKEREMQQSKLFPRAVWETPADPYRVLYADQLVNGVLSTGINSDIPGTIRIKVTEPVMDRWGHGHTIIPVDTTFLGQQQGTTNFGQTRIPAQITMAILPNGTAIQWKNGQASDALGRAGIPADVDNHYVKLFVGVGLQALLNIGVRVPFGSPGAGQFQQNLPQEFAQDAAQGVTQAGQRIITQQFSVKPTLTQEFGYAVSISFSENVSFMTRPDVIKK